MVWLVALVGGARINDLHDAILLGHGDEVQTAAFVQSGKAINVAHSHDEDVVNVVLAIGSDVVKIGIRDALDAIAHSDGVWLQVLKLEEVCLGIGS